MREFFALPKKLQLRLLEKELTTRSLADFVKLAWLVHHATPPVWGWHMDLLCDYLTAVADGQITHLAIAIPPGMGKSLIVSVYYPAWLWIRRPSTQILAASASPDVALRDAVRAREIIESPWFLDLYAPAWKIKKSQDSKSFYGNTASGFRVSKTTGQRITGVRADLLILDDPIDAADAHSDSPALAEVATWHDTVWATRRNSSASAEIIISQRLHPDDLIGHVTRADDHPWTLVVLPMEHDPDRAWQAPEGLPCDPRTERGELLHPEWLSAADVARIRREVGERAYAAQYQQHPQSEAGNIFSRDNFVFWTTAQKPEPEYVVFSADLNRLKKRKHTRDTDYAVIDVWGVAGDRYYLLGEVRERMGLGQQIETIKHLYARYSAIYRACLIEKSANGPSVIAALESEIPGITPISVQGESKIQRASAVVPVVEAGRVFIPNPEEYPWVTHWLAEVCGFPGRRRDDRVDTLSQAIIWLEEHRRSRPFSFAL